MEDEGEEVVVTGTRLRDEDEASGGGGGADWGWASFYSGSGGFGTDGFDFGGGGSIDTVVVTAPAEQPAEEEPPAEEEGEEVVVTAPAPPTDEALVTGLRLTQWAHENVVGDFRVTLDGNTARIEIYDVLTEQHVVYVESPDGNLLTHEEFDLDSYERDPSFFQAPVFDPIPVDWL